MRNVTLRARVAREAGQCFDRISEFARYPDLVDVIRAVTVYPVTGDGTEQSAWEVYFRNGILRWEETDWPDREALLIRFEQIDGDFDHFAGSWEISADPADSGASLVTFDSDFDFGIPSLAGILDPVAERVFKETIARVLTGLFDEIDVLGDPEVAAALAATPAPAEAIGVG
jgi:ribosome-associated toxin RatA of RatAB toxin-antitoxin module